MKVPRWLAEGLFLWAFDCNLSSIIILRHIIAPLIITSNNTFAMFASNSEYLDNAANAYIEQIKDQDTLTKTKSILSYASKMDGTTENCVTAALNVYNLCESSRNKMPR